MGFSERNTKYKVLSHHSVEYNRHKPAFDYRTILSKNKHFETSNSKLKAAINTARPFEGSRTCGVVFFEAWN